MLVILLTFLSIVICNAASAVVSPDPTSTTTQWQIQVVEDGEYVGQYSSIAVDSNGNPHISYSYSTGEINGDLKYASKDSTGWSTETVDSAPRAGEYNSLAIDKNNNPHISYLAMNPDESYSLKYATKTSTGWQTQTIDTNLRGEYTSIAVDSNGNPGIIYVGDVDGDFVLKYAYFKGAWNTESITMQGHGASLAFDSSNIPHVSSYSGGSSIRYWTRGISGWTSELISNVVVPGFSEVTSLKIDSTGTPHISFADYVPASGEHILKYANKASSGWTTSTVYSESGWVVGMYNALAVDSSNLPHIVFGKTNSDGSVVICHAYIKNDAWEIETIANSNQYKYGPVSVAIDPKTDNIHVSYYSSLEYAFLQGPARPTNPSPTANAQTTVNAQSNTIPMQETGMPFAGLFIAVLMAIGGLALSRRTNK